MISASTLSQFSGTESYTWGPFRRFVMTDGVVYLCEYGCGWFADLIASYQNAKLHKAADGFQVWKLLKLDGDPKHMAVAVCEDGNGRKLQEQKIEFTDFPFADMPEGLTVYLEHGSVDGENLVWVAMLPGER